MVKIETLNVLELFGGIGAIRKALIRQKIPHKVIDYVEIDKNCVKSYNALYNADFKPKSIIGYNPPKQRIDLLMHGSPCQDFSRAGLKQGGERGSGTRSSLLFETIRIIEEMAMRPKIVIWENVKGAFSSNAGADFWAILQALAHIGGYRLEFQLLNTSWVLPQNRERIYLIGHLAGRSQPGVFPIGKNDKLLDRKAREKDRKSTSIKTSLARTITSRYHKMGSNDTYIIPKKAATLTGGGHSGGLHSDMTVIQINPSTESNGRQPYQQNRVFDVRGISPALTRHNSNYAISRMRRLTEIECERLQGFPDNWTQYGDYNGAIKPIAKTQRYKLIGNAVTVDIVELIAKRLKFIEP